MRCTPILGLTPRECLEVLLGRIQRAVFDAVERFPSRRRRHEIAEVADASVNAITKQLNPNGSDSNITLRTIVATLIVTGDREPIHTICNAFGLIAVEKPESGDAEATLAALVRAGEQFGELCRSVRAAMEDGTITRDEAKKIQRECYAMASLAYGVGECAVEAATPRRLSVAGVPR